VGKRPTTLRACHRSFPPGHFRPSVPALTAACLLCPFISGSVSRPSNHYVQWDYDAPDLCLRPRRPWLTRLSCQKPSFPTWMAHSYDTDLPA